MFIVTFFSLLQSVLSKNPMKREKLILDDREKRIEVTSVTSTIWISWLCCHACFEQGVPWHLGNQSLQIHSKTCTWHDNNIHLKIFILYIFPWVGHKFITTNTISMNKGKEVSCFIFIPFVSLASFLYPLKKSENLMIFWL